MTDATNKVSEFIFLVGWFVTTRSPLDNAVLDRIGVLEQSMTEEELYHSYNGIGLVNERLFAEHPELQNASHAEVVSHLRREFARISAAEESFTREHPELRAMMNAGLRAPESPLVH